jgi:hypothetical protein
MRAFSAGLAVVSLVAGCAAHVQQPLIVDGEPFTPARCHSGQPLRINGVVLVDPAGRRLLLSMGGHAPKSAARHAAPAPATASGAPGLVVFTSPQDAGDPMGLCGSVTLRHEPGTKPAQRSVSGTASLSCSSEEHTVVGTVSFDGCH